MIKKFNYKDIFSLKNKKIVILGGSKMGINFSKILSSAGVKYFSIKKAVNKPKIQYSIAMFRETSMKSFFEKTFKQEKKIHTLIYNVYSKPKDYYKKFEDYDDKVWEKVMQSNLSGAYKASKKMISHFKKKKISGNIILVLSTYGLVGPDFSIY